MFLRSMPQELILCLWCGELVPPVASNGHYVCHECNRVLTIPSNMADTTLESVDNE